MTTDNGPTTDEPTELNSHEYELEADRDDEYDRSATGKLVLEGSHGTITILARYRAMLDDDNELMEAGTIRETRQLFHEDVYRDGIYHDPYTDERETWSVSMDTLTDWDAFLADCEISLTHDPELVYELAVEKLPQTQ